MRLVHREAGRRFVENEHLASTSQGAADGHQRLLGPDRSTTLVRGSTPLPTISSALRLSACASAQSMRPRRRGYPVPSATFSATDSPGTRPRSWWMNEMRPAAWGAQRDPQTVTSPLSRVYTPASTLITVDLPAPFCPSRASTDPGEHIQVDVVQRLRCAESLGNPAEADERLAS